MNAPTRVPDMMAYILRIPLITVASEIVQAFKEKNTKGLAALMIRECVRKGESQLMSVSDAAVGESKQLYDLLGRAYGRLALAAGINPIMAIAFQTGFESSIEVVEDFPPRFFDDGEFQEIFTYAESLLIRYTGSPNLVRKDVEQLLSGSGQ